MIGCEPWAYPPLGKTFLPNLESWLSNLSAAQDDAQAAHKVAQLKMKEQISSKFTPWKVGDKVWLKMTNLHMNRPCYSMDGPLSFSSTHNPAQQALKEEQHDLTLDHAMDSSFLFPLSCHDSFLDKNLEI